MLTVSAITSTNSIYVRHEWVNRVHHMPSTQLTQQK